MGGKKRKKKEQEYETNSVIQSSDSDSEYSDASESPLDKYKPYRVADYSRRYPEDSPGHEHVVFIASSDENVPIGSRDMMYLSNSFTRFVKGIKYFKKVNKYRMGVVFDNPNMANSFLDNATFHREHRITASIPAAVTEITGVITNVPSDLSNKTIFKVLSTTTKKIICVRRIMRKVKEGESYNLQPTQTVAITFASCASLPDYVYLKMWRVPVLPYIPPIKQCFRCLRYGHLAKFCKNAERCSICTEGHSFKNCNVSLANAVCIHCKGNHIAISGTCPVKKQKIIENKNKIIPQSYSETLKNNAFPSLTNPKNSQEFQKLVLSDTKMLSFITEAIIKVISHNKINNNTIVNTKTIADTLKDILKTNSVCSENSQV
ncbi:uncharacterized protein LOC135309869 [Plodia interpunctella]|uniref:uncharacterized protein LOC135309869 n=1 Tax=Plodia interpunctella TaxID=58824 RepID=UPI003101A703